MIGRGRLVAELSMDELSARAPRSVRVRTREPERLSAVLAGSGLLVEPGANGSLSIGGADTDAIAEAAAAAEILLSEITPEHASLEDVFMALTHGSVEYQADVDSPGGNRNDGRPIDARRQA